MSEKYSDKYTTFTARVEKVTWKKFLLIATANDRTAADLFRQWVNEYIRENSDAVKRVLEE